MFWCFLKAEEFTLSTTSMSTAVTDAATDAATAAAESPVSTSSPFVLLLKVAISVTVRIIFAAFTLRAHREHNLTAQTPHHAGVPSENAGFANNLLFF